MPAAASTLDAFITRVGGIETPFSIAMPDGERQTIGQGQPAFHVELHNERAVRAVRTLDEGDIAEAYLQGDIDIEGDMLKPFALRAELDDSHPLMTAWRFVEPLLFGQVYTNKQAIASHYNADPKLFLSFLDPVMPAYTQGIYEHDDEPLAKAVERKFDWAIEKCGLGPGKTVLEIGPRLGRVRRPRAASRRALHRHHQLRRLTVLSEIEARQFRRPVRNSAHRLLRLRARGAVRRHRHHGRHGHLPHYRRVLDKFYSLLKPGGFVYLDEASAWKKYEISSFMVRHIFPGNHSFLVLDDFINKIPKSGLELMEVHNDRWSYHLTFKQWALNLETSKDSVRANFGDFEYRKFRLYLWGAAYEFLAHNLGCFRLLLNKPKDAAT